MSYEKVIKLEQKRKTLLSAQDTLYWDQSVTMPENGIGVRAQQYQVLSSLMHETLISDEFAAALTVAEKEQGLNESQQANLRELRRTLDRAVNLSPELVEEIAG